MKRTSFAFLIAILFSIQCSVAIKAQPHGHPSFIGFDVGTGLTVWQNATPTYFPTVYPYTAIPDTIHVPFNSGATPLFGFFLAVSGDFHLDPEWSILAKFGYAEKRGIGDQQSPPRLTPTARPASYPSRTSSPLSASSE